MSCSNLNKKGSRVRYAVPSPLGTLCLDFYKDQLAGLLFAIKTSSHVSQSETSGDLSVYPLLQTCITELALYFQDPGYIFSLPLYLEGTVFQQKVWHALCQIPRGSTLSYGVLAKQLDTSPRAVGNACRANPIAIIIPCHRVVAKSHLGGYTGETKGQLMDIKKWLLQHESLR